jgi:hypothetical protein
MSIEDRYVLRDGGYVWEGELDEEEQERDARELSIAIRDLALPFLLTCDDPLGVLATAEEVIVDNAVAWLDCEGRWVLFEQTPEEIHESLMFRRCHNGRGSLKEPVEDLYNGTECQWQGEIDEDDHALNVKQLCVSVWDFALPFLLTCDDPISVLECAMNNVAADLFDLLPMCRWVPTERTPSEIMEALMARSK